MADDQVFTRMTNPLDGSMPGEKKDELIQGLNQAYMQMQGLLSSADKQSDLIAELRQKLTVNRVGFYGLGLAVGGLTGYFVAKRVLQTKYSQIAADEVSEMREHYNAKLRAAEATAAKRPIEDIVAERGYSSPDKDTTKPPMAVQPPSGVREAAEEEVDTPQKRQEVIDNLDEAEQRVKNVFEEHGDEDPVSDEPFEWNWEVERRRRSPNAPYVIHIDEREEMEDYDIHTLTYYEADDVLCNERDEIVDPDHERDQLVGEANLNRFGHGSDDPSIVYVRNDKLELVYEIVKSPNSFAEEVHGIKHDDSYRGNLERMRARERDDPET